MIPLNSIYFYLTDCCNLACAHCWLSPKHISSKADAPDRIGAEDVKKVIAEAKPLGLGSAKLTGGEPFMNREIFEIIEAISSEGIHLHIETNGTLIDQETASFLAAHNTNHISISIDSATAMFHDSFRGVSGSFDDAIAGAEHCVGEKLNVQFIMSLTTENVNDIEEVMRLAERVGVSSVKINPVIPLGRGANLSDNGVVFGAEDLVRLNEYVEGELARRYAVEIYFSIPSAFKPIKKFLTFDNSECNILNILGIIPNGDISICGIGKEEKDLVMGNIRKDAIADVWEKSPVLQRLRDIVPKKMEGICGRCLLKGRCLGSCRADAFVLTRNLAAPFWICQDAFEAGIFPKTRMM